MFSILFLAQFALAQTDRPVPGHPVWEPKINVTRKKSPAAWSISIWSW